ncbi:MAG: hypothetical protein GY951_08580 [Psychromonas sp.]|nr:hypothetical protein [Psychromonas sp.]
MVQNSSALTKTTNQDVISKLGELYRDVFDHDGYGDMRIEIRILRRSQKEVIIHCGKQYRFIVDFDADSQSAERVIG